MTIDALQAAMKLSNWINHNKRRVSDVTVKTIIKEEERMFKGKQTCSDPVSLDDACKIIGRAMGKDRIVRQTLYRYLRNGDLLSYKIKNKTVLSRSEIQEFIIPRRIARI